MTLLSRLSAKMKDREGLAKMLASQPSSFVSGVTAALRFEKAMYDADAVIRWLSE